MSKYFFRVKSVAPRIVRGRAESHYGNCSIAKRDVGSKRTGLRDYHPNNKPFFESAKLPSANILLNHFGLSVKTEIQNNQTELQR